jgi:hypothetical protein
MTKEFTLPKDPFDLFKWLFIKCWPVALAFFVIVLISIGAKAQIILKQDYQNFVSAPIGTFQGINFREAGFSGLYAIPGTNGKEFWTVSDRGVNVDAANANSAACRPTYDKIYAFQNYAPKIHRIRLNADNSLQILQTITMKRPNGLNASGIINPAGFGSTAAEVASTDTVLNCANFNSKIATKDVWGIDSEGIVVDKDGFFWICEEGGPTIWKLNSNGVVVKRFTPYANLLGAEPQDVQIDSVFKYRKNNRGFEGISITPNGKIYAIIQSPILYPSKTVGEATRVHRILEINPADNSTRMFAYLNDGIIGASGSNQIRLRDWKIGDMAAINDHTFLVLEAALRGTTDIKRMYLIDISGATPVTSALYSGKTLEALVDAAGLSANGIVPVTKMLFMDLLANGWPSALEKAEGLAILNDSTIAIGNDNDFGQVSPLENGIATATTNLSHVFIYGLTGANKIANYQSTEIILSQGKTGPSTSNTPYLLPTTTGAEFTSILTATESINGYMMAGLPDGLGAFDNGDGTFTVLMNHEMGNSVGAIHAHGVRGAFVSKWVINKSDLSVVSGADLIQNVNLWNGSGYTPYNTTSPQPLGFSRFCSADLPAVSAFFNASSGLGTQERIFMNGEENGSEGRALAHIATGVNAGTTYELPALGKLSFENSVASPASGDKTVVAGTDDSTPGQVYIYIGNKTATGNEIEKAGLTNGKLFGVSVAGLFTETSSSVPSPGTTFSLIDLGDVKNLTGTQLNTNSNNAGVTTFLRPEDSAWDPSSPNDFYFVTTNAFTSPSRMWRLRFTDIHNPELGGTITAVLDGTEGQKMLDNITIDHYGHVLLVEDVGGNAHLGKTWQYTIATDEFKQVGTHDETRFLIGSSNFLTQDEEASGIIDVQEILGKGMFLTVDQAHYSIPGDAVEGGQLLAFYNPDTYSTSNEIGVRGNDVAISDGDMTPTTADNTDFGTVNVGSTLTKTFVIKNDGPGILKVSGISFFGINADEFSLTDSLNFPLNVYGDSSQTIAVKFSPIGSGVSTATVSIINNDSDESNFNFALQGNGCLLTADSITGPTNACAFAGASGSTATYSIHTTDASGYIWKVPAKATLISGQGTNAISVKYASAFVSGTISVVVTNACGGESITKTLVINKAKPAMPAVIAGPTSACSFIATDSLVTYSVAQGTNATSYLWTVPAHVTLASGQGTASINVKFNYGYTSALIKVRAIAACGSSAERTLKVTAAPPSQPGLISGPVYGICTPSSTVVYNVNPVSNATSYTWTTSIAGTTISTDSTTALITFPSFVSGLVSVYASNACGNSALRSLRVYATPSAPATIMGSDSICIGSTQTYYTDSIDNVISYAWSVPKGSIIQSGNGSPAINVLVGGNSGYVKVKAINNCGNSTVRSLAVTVENCSSAFARTASPLVVYPVPSSGLVNVSFESVKPEAYEIHVNDVITNEVVYTKRDTTRKGMNDVSLDLSSLHNGFYVIHVVSGSINYNERIEIRK